MAKPTKPKTDKTNNKSVRAPRVRKTETVRERNKKVAAKVEARANKHDSGIKHRLKKLGSKIFRPLKKPLHILSAPLRLRPVRAIGRVLGLILWPRYFRNSYQEVKQVTWPSRRDTWKLTFAVLIFAVLFGLAAAGADFILDKIIRRIVFRG